MVHLQRRGRDVVLVDRNSAAGDETSYGNAGLIEVASVFPYMFPRDLGHLLRYAFNGSADVRYQLSGLPEFLPWLLRYFQASSPEGAAPAARIGAYVDWSLSGGFDETDLVAMSDPKLRLFIYTNQSFRY